jgi:AraC-like DNA-binding protein
MTDIYRPNILPSELWHEDGVDQRSRELTPLYVEHFTGPLISRNMTYHDCWELILVRNGHGEMRTAEPFALEPGTVGLIPPGVSHIEYARHYIDIFWIGLHGTRVEGMRHDRRRIVVSDSVIRGITPLWNLAQKSYGRIGPELDALTAVLFARFRQSLGVTDEAIHLRIDNAVTYMHVNFREEISMPKLADMCGYSDGYFYRAFKHLTGKTPVQYLTSLRIQESLRWLQHSDLPIQRIAELVGFTDYRYFSRVFKNITGCSPHSMRTL